MTKMILVIEIMSMAGAIIAMKKDRTLAELMLWDGILIIANALAWQM